MHPVLVLLHGGYIDLYVTCYTQGHTEYFTIWDYTVTECSNRLDPYVITTFTLFVFLVREVIIMAESIKLGQSLAMPNGRLLFVRAGLTSV